MPHSSGGGSHGGGSHGGSHGGGGGRSSVRVSTTRYVGSRRYSYYDKHHVKQYIYCSQDPAKAFRPRWALLLFYIPFLAVIFMIAQDIVHIPSKVENYSSDILIEDEAGLITDAAALSASLSGFYNETGVTPAVITTYHSAWSGNYSSLEKYAFDLYVNRFSDEKHWLVVYSIPDRKAADGFVDWRWEGMIGNDVGSMIKPRHENYFTAQMQKNLTTERYTLDEAVSRTFSETLAEASKVSVDWESLLMFLFILAFILLHACLMIGITPKQLRYSKAVYDPDPKDLPVNCHYCNSRFILGDHVNCPNCGGPLEPEQKSAAVQPAVT